jgi:hypothetical protein
VVLINGYLNVSDFREEIGDERMFSTEAPYERAIGAASRWIDRHCQRRFWLSPSPESKLVRATSRVSIRPADFPDPGVMTVAVDLLGDGTFTPLSSVLWQAEPFAPENGWPYERITPTDAPCWPTDPQRARVKVTGIFGWAQVPPEVEQACSILARAYLNQGDVTGEKTGFESWVDDPMSPLGAVKHLLHEFSPHCCEHDRHGRT